jgi:hypothetical protein
MKKSNVIKTISAAMAITFLSSFAIAMTDGKSTVRIDLTMTAQQRTELLQPVKVDIYNTEIRVFELGKQTIHSYVTASSRGQSSILMPRKNLKIQSVYKDQEGKAQKLTIAGIGAKKLILSSGSADPLLTKNMSVYRLYEVAGLPTMKTSYAEVTINGVSQGLHMVSENADDHILKDLNADIAFRRGYLDSLELREQKKTLSEQEVAAYTAALNAIYSDIKKLKGAELLASLEKRMNFKNYLRMLAMNYLVKNGDYYDELYLYGTKNAAGEMYFDVFPWDFDDSFSAKMHLSVLPGYSNNSRSKRSEKQMLFSFESRIDMAISQDAVLLNKYFEVFGEVVSKLTAEKINQSFANVSALVAPYITDPDVLAQGTIDTAKIPYTTAGVLASMNTHRVSVLQAVEKARTELALIKTEPKTRADKMSGLQVMLGRLQQKLIRKFTGR